MPEPGVSVLSEAELDLLELLPERARAGPFDMDKLDLGLIVVPYDSDMDFNDLDIFLDKYYSVPSYFKTGKTEDDDMWLSMLDDSPRPQETRIYHLDYFPFFLRPSSLYPESNTSYTRRYFELPLKRRVCSLLCETFQGLWEGFRDISDAANDNSAYFHMTIRLATTLICLLYNQETLYILFEQPSPELIMQLNTLWEELVVLGKQGCPLEEAYELVLSKVTAYDFCFVTETEIAQMLNFYRIQLEARDLLLCPTFTLPYKGAPIPEKEKDNLYDEIWDVIDKMESPRELMADSYTRLLIKVIKGEVDKKELIDIALKDIDTSAMDSLLDQDIPSPWTPRKLTQDEHKLAFGWLLDHMISDLSSRLADKLMYALMPMSQLLNPDDYYFLSNEVIGVIRVAEIRRIAVGRRFIGRKHLLWAFYECGNVIPPSIKKDDLRLAEVMYDYHPSYRVYLSSARLAKSFGDKVRLESFLYAIFHTDDTGISALERQENYKAFVKDLLKCSTDSNDLKTLHFLRELPRHPLPPFRL